MLLKSILLFLSAVNALPTSPSLKDSPSEVKRDIGDFTTSITSVETKSAEYSASDITNSLTDNLQSLFWKSDSSSWKDSCDQSRNPVVWQVAVAGKVLTNTGDSSKASDAIDALNRYKSNTNEGGFSASTAKNGDIYTDDVSQVSWVFVDTYHITGEQTYLDEAKKIQKFLENWEDDKQNGGILWSINGKYIALISTLEAALAALKLNDADSDQYLVDFAKSCIDWTFDHLKDDGDSFIYDGMYEDGNINKGKLTYTIGVLMSCCAYLDKIGDDSKSWKSIGVEYGVKLAGGGKLDTRFFSNGHINDIVDRSHLLWAGISDLLQMTYPTSIYEFKAYDMLKNLAVREARHLYDGYPDMTKDSCPDTSYKSLLKYASLGQIFYEVSRVSSDI